MRQVVVLRQVPHEDLGTIDSALRDAGLEIRYLDLYDRPPAELDTTQLCGLVVLGVCLGSQLLAEIDATSIRSQTVKYISALHEMAGTVFGSFARDCCPYHTKL